MDMLQELKEYFNQNTDEQIKKDWDKSKEFDEIKPTVDEFLKNTNIMKKEICDCDYFCQRQGGKFCTKWEEVIETTTNKKQKNETKRKSK